MVLHHSTELANLMWGIHTVYPDTLFYFSLRDPPLSAESCDNEFTLTLPHYQIH